MADASQHVFISYSSRDQAIAEELCANLEHAAVRCWMAPRDIRAGQDWSATISSAINDSTALLLVLSADSNASRQVAHEVHIAHSADKSIVPFRIEEIEPDGALGYLISGLHRIDALRVPREPAYEALTQELLGIRDGAPAETSETAPIRGNLPRGLSSFVGRDEEVAQIVSLLQKSALVTLVGTGGVGKTRCALRVGESLFSQFEDGVWLVELAAVTNASLVPNGISQALGIPESPSRGPLETLLGYLRRKEMLLILDNSEHVITEASRAVSSLLAGCPRLRVLATSREELRVAGEHVFRMPSLAFPKRGAYVSQETAGAYASLALFTDRAVAVDSRFAVTDDNARVIAEICRRLDGVPLAIELAAARVKLLSPQQLLKKLDERFNVLTGGDRTALPRHQTMRALIDWSYNLLSEDEQSFFRRLSIFAGGFTLETVAAICDDRLRDEMAVLELLGSLVDKSLVQVDSTDVGARYRLLDSIRQYARDKLVDCDELDGATQAHARAFMAMAEEVEGKYERTPDSEWLALIEVELDNWRAAFDWSFSERGDASMGQTIAGVLREALYHLVPVEGRRWVQSALDKVTAETPIPTVARLHLAAARLDLTLSHTKESQIAAEQALAFYRALEDSQGTSEAAILNGRTLVFLGRQEEGQQLLSEGLLGAQSLDAQKLVALALDGLAWGPALSGDLSTARERYRKALNTANAAGANGLAATVSHNLAEIEFQAGDPATALRLANDALTLHRAQNDAFAVSDTLKNTVPYLLALSRYSDALARARDAVKLCHDLNNVESLVYAVQYVAAIAVAQPYDNPDEKRNRSVVAAQLLGFVNEAVRVHEFVREYAEQQEYDKVAGALRAELTEEELTKLMNDGSAWDEDRAVEEAILV